MNRLTRFAVIGGTALGLSLVASPALAEPECTYVDGTTNCRTVTVLDTKENKNKTTTTTRYQTTTDFAGEVFYESDSTERQAVTDDGDVTTRTEQTYTQNGQTCEVSSSSKTKNGEFRKGKYDNSCLNG